MTEFLSAWDKSREPSFAAFHIVGPAHSPGAHQLRDDLSRIGVPYRFFDNDSEQGRQLLREHHLEDAQVPVVLRRDGSALVDPSHMLARADGLTAEGPDRVVRLAGGSQVAARTVIIATGVTWRRLGVPALEALVGAGVFYGAAGATGFNF